MNIPLEILKNQLIRIPFVRTRAKRLHSTGANQNPESVRRIVDFYRERAPTLQGSTVLELGPGQTHQVAEQLVSELGCSVMMLDIQGYHDVREMKELGLDYRLYDGRVFPVDSSSLDCVFSYTVYEHLRHPRLTVQETFRVLRPGGTVVHLIDLGDHFSYGGSEVDLFNCLKYPTWLWNLMTYHRSNYVNRVRFSEWVLIHEEAGFEVVATEKKESEETRTRFRDGRLQYLRGVQEEDRFCSGVGLVARKPA